MKWNYRYYYTLEEVCRPMANKPFGPINHTKTRTPNLKDVGEAFYDINGAGTPSWISSTGADFEYLNELWQRIRHKFNREGAYFYISDDEYDVTVQEDLDELHAKASARALDLLETIYETKDKYIALIKKQADLESSLLTELKRTNESWFNDTPQSRGSYIDNDHTTTYNKSEETIPLGNVADKLEIVRQAMNDIYDEWLVYFNKFIIWD